MSRTNLGEDRAELRIALSFSILRCRASSIDTSAETFDVAETGECDVCRRTCSARWQLAEIKTTARSQANKVVRLSCMKIEPWKYDQV